MPFQTVKGFRDFFPEECALRNYIFAKWRATAGAYGLVEYEGPALESTDLYRKKSGDEIVHQLFAFRTKGEEEVSLRPEVTPSLARMVAERQRCYPKPLKWFQIGPCYRYERQQRGRLREFNQFNVDIAGVASPSADAELIACAIDTLRALGLTRDDFVIRLSDRKLWEDFRRRRGIAEDRSGEFLHVIDKMERAPALETDEKLRGLGCALDEVRSFIAGPAAAHEVFAPIRADLEARGLWDFVRIDPGIVRGLAYYSGVVFEAFDLRHDLRAIAGGGRYDGLVSLMSDGALDMPACGFAMGDVVLGELVAATPSAKQAADEWIRRNGALDLFVVVADEQRRPEGLGIVQRLRDAGWRTEFSLVQHKVGKQFQSAEGRSARLAVVVGAEFPVLVVKSLRTRDQMEVPVDRLLERISELMSAPEYRHLIA